MIRATPHLIYRLFPNLIASRWGYLDFNEIATDLCTVLNIGQDDPNPFLEPEIVNKWVSFIYKMKEIDYSWGGWLENRSILWRGHYQKPDECVHLGVDINVPAGTPVIMPVNGTLVHSFNDPDQDGGWGGKVIFQCKGFYLILGHLRSIPSDIGAEFKQGRCIGVVAEPECNGGWYPHLHVQTMKSLIPDIDGYAAYYKGIEKDFPDPTKVNLWHDST